MGLSKYRQNLGVAASTLGILQGVTWTFLTLIAILIHYWKPDVEAAKTYIDTIETVLYYKFLVDSGIPQEKFLLGPHTFIIAMWVYFVVSVLWCTLSVDQLTAIQFKKNRQGIVMILWGILTLFISLGDVIFVALLGTDYAACEDESDGVTEEEYYCYLTEGIVMAIAARGFTLWVVNVTLSIVLVKEATGVIRDNDNNASMYTSTIPRARLANRFFHNFSQNNSSPK